jgi:hypothetical protein
LECGAIFDVFHALQILDPKLYQQAKRGITGTRFVPRIEPVKPQILIPCHWQYTAAL